MNALILMTRIPIPGKTKTRLMKLLSGEECAGIHRCFLMDIFNTFEALKENTDIFITYTPEDRFNLVQDIIPKYASSFPQTGDNLGERMKNAINSILEKGYEKVILTGSDIPHLKAEDIKNAFELLNTNDIALGPAFDGGYYLIGMKQMYSEIFDEDLKWGYKSVFQGTVDIANKHNLKVGLAEKYRDIDTEQDLLHFIEEFEGKKLDDNIEVLNTITFIKNLWSDLNNVKRYIGR